MESVYPSSSQKASLWKVYLLHNFPEYSPDLMQLYPLYLYLISLLYLAYLQFLSQDLLCIYLMNRLTDLLFQLFLYHHMWHKNYQPLLLTDLLLLLIPTHSLRHLQLEKFQDKTQHPLLHDPAPIPHLLSQ